MPHLSTNPADYEDLENESAHRKRKGARVIRSKHALLAEATIKTSLQDLGADEVFTPSLSFSHHEREWIFSYLSPFYENQIISDVLRRAKGGKEANVYVCRAHPSQGQDYLAAKLYRPRMMRNLRNDARYRQNRVILGEDGKEITNSGMLHAVAKGTSFGKELAHVSWLQHEYITLQRLFEAGVPVPEPVASSGNAILMNYIGDLDLPAPTLVETSLSAAQARRCFEELIHALEMMLASGVIHADLSAYNVLWWDEAPTIIDFPQAVSPYRNPEAEDILRRDIERLCEHFERYGIRTNIRQLAKNLWQKYGPQSNMLDLEATLSRFAVEVEEEQEEPLE